MRSTTTSSAAAVLDWRRRRQLRAAEARARAARVWLPIALYLFAVAALTVIASVIALVTTDTGKQVGSFLGVVVPAAFGVLNLRGGRLRGLEAPLRRRQARMRSLCGS